VKNIKEIALEILRKKHPKAEFALLAGSLIRGEGTKYSDLDIVVIYRKLKKAYRESFTFKGCLVELFIHDPETAMFFMEKFDRPAGSPALANMILEGIEIPGPAGLSAALKRLAKKHLEKGPGKQKAETLRYKRYIITCLVDDIRDPRNQDELNGSLTALYADLANFYFKAHRQWVGGDKNIPRSLFKADPALARQFNSAFSKAFKSGSTKDVIHVVQRILKPFGGFLFNGYRSAAKKSNRMKIKNLGRGL
jgi:predicted nucleotidyltransferase